MTSPLDDYLEPVELPAPLIPPPAGTWIRFRCQPSREKPDGWQTRTWHLFLGDLLWRPRWTMQALLTACGYWGHDYLDLGIATSDDPGPAACHRCATRRIGRLLVPPLSEPG